MEQGGVVLVVGMATVFAFLLLLVSLMLGSAWFFRAFPHGLEKETAHSSPPPRDLADIAVALAAIHARGKFRHKDGTSRKGAG